MITITPSSRTRSRLHDTAPAAATRERGLGGVAGREWVSEGPPSRGRYADGRHRGRATRPPGCHHDPIAPPSACRSRHAAVGPPGEGALRTPEEVRGGGQLAGRGPVERRESGR